MACTKCGGLGWIYWPGPNGGGGPVTCPCKDTRPALGSRMYWTDPDDGLCSGWGVVTQIEGDIITIAKDDGGGAEVFAHELSEAKP
jgi:hypothetical protein